MTDTGDPRLDEILEALLALSRQDFGHRIEVRGQGTLDAIAAGLNMLGEELEGAVAPRSALEAALAQQHAAEASLVHAERLAVMGQLVGGVAHEINNPAGWVSLGLTVALRELGAVRAMLARGELTSELDRAEADRRLEAATNTLVDATEGMERIRSVVADLRSFARPDDDVEEAISLSEVVRASTRLAAPSFEPDGIRIELRLEETPALAAHHGRIAQVVTNLLLNAVQALLGHAEPRVVRVTTRTEAGGALLVVEDSGPGVPEEIRARIFQPFFTTKAPELGTGLGLSLVRQIVERYRGDVRVGTSELGGARFEIWLPAGVARVAPSVRRAARASTGRARILVVDDEPAILRAMKSLLMAEHDVVLAEGGRRAIELLEQDVLFDLVVSDLHMPDVDGADLYGWIEDHVPRLEGRVVLCSGASLSPKQRAFVARTGPVLLEKPISTEALDALFARML